MENIPGNIPYVYLVPCVPYVYLVCKMDFKIYLSLLKNGNCCSMFNFSF